MGKFSDILSSTGNVVLKRRAEMIAASAKDEAMANVQNIERELREIDMRIFNLEDLSVKSTESLIVGENFNSKEWNRQMFEIKLMRRDKVIELEIAKQVLEDYFGNDVENCDK